LFVAILSGHEHAVPLFIELGHEPSVGSGFVPGILWVPENSHLFIGAGTKILCYDLSVPKRVWEDVADTGFWGWKRHDDFVLMSAELEVAAWRISGEKCWTTFVEPPWTYRVEGDAVMLDVMGHESRFPLDTGPKTR
jgi:hypothetical protein